MNFTLFEFDKEFGPRQQGATLMRTRKHDSVFGAYIYEFQLPKAMLVCSVYQGNLGEASYRFTSILPWVRTKLANELFELYGGDKVWKLDYQNKDGKMYFSHDEQLYAAVGKSAKFVNIGSMMYHQEKFRIVS